MNFTITSELLETIKPYTKNATITTVQPWSVAVENIIAIRQAAKLMGLSRNDVEDLFYNNAQMILK